MHILIDVQGLQSESKTRGIGRYTLELTRAIILNRGKHRVSLLINGLYPVDNINNVKSKFTDILSINDIYIFSGVSPIEWRDQNNHSRNRITQECRNIAIENISPDIVLISSFFEGFFDDFAVSIPKDCRWKTFVICYDLIPFLNKKAYLQDSFLEQFYMDKLSELSNATCLLAISESSRKEAITHANFADENVFNISSGVSDKFRRIEISDEHISSLTSKLHLPEKFILSLAMIEPRKNIEAVIIAYSKLPRHLQDTYHLVLAYKVSADDKERIKKLARYNGIKESLLIFTGYLDDDDLIALYNLCTLFVFPSLHEGFGLPPLEAMKCGAATLGSNTTSLPEVIGWDSAMFDPTNPDAISDTITKALTDPQFYAELKANAIRQSGKFSWDLSAQRAIHIMGEYVDKTEQQNKKTFDITNYLTKIKEIPGVSEHDRLKTAWAIARSCYSQHTKKVLVDVSVLIHHDAKTGIQRVSRSILNQLIAMRVDGYEIYPVYYTIDECYRFANNFYAANFNAGVKGDDSSVLFNRNDILLVADLTAHLFPAILTEIEDIRRAGAHVSFIVYDMLPILHPEWCDIGIQNAFPVWMKSIASHADQLICISASVAAEVKDWISKQEYYTNPHIQIDSFHLGADLEGSMPSKGIPDSANSFLQKMDAVPTFLMVGTLEPRKGHEQTLEAFKKLWAEGHNFQLCIIGKQGWNVESLVTEIKKSPELNKRLFWLQGISDEYLGLIYARSCALIFASNGEGFGLPLIEAAQKNIPLIIRDIPVFREIVETHAYYFDGQEPAVISEAIIEWYSLFLRDAHPKSNGVKWLTWNQSVGQLLSKLPLIK